MKRLVPVLAVGLTSWVAYVLIAGRGDPVQANARQVATRPSKPDLAEARAREQAVYEQQTQARIQELARMENERRLRGQVEAKALAARRELRRAKSAAWRAVISTNWPAFQSLRQKAASSPGKSVPCAVCDGSGSMGFCIVCDHTGKCVSCKGTGRAAFDERCATCLGAGKCYFCLGSGRMPCPFCDDGTISLGLPPPPAQMPTRLLDDGP